MVRLRACRGFLFWVLTWLSITQCHMREWAWTSFEHNCGAVLKHEVWLPAWLCFDLFCAETKSKESLPQWAPAAALQPNHNAAVPLTFFSAFLLLWCSSCSVLKKILGKQVQGFEDSVFSVGFFCLFVCMVAELSLETQCSLSTPLWVASRLDFFYCCTIWLNRKI